MGETRYQPRRSLIFAPGTRPDMYPKALKAGADIVCVDLEDAIAPEHKDEARAKTLALFAEPSADDGIERMVRINQGDRGLEDLEFIAPHNVHVILIPKVESPEQVRQVDERIREILSRAAGAGSPDDVGSPRGAPAQDPSQNGVFLMPIIESALGAIRSYEIATASDNNVALAIGLEDYTADIGTQRTPEGRESFWARSQVVNAARATGIQPIDTVFSDVADLDGLRESVVEAKSLGFDGKGCIHPRQIAVIHEAFAPSKAELEKARRIVAAFGEAEKNGLGVVSLGSKMIDPPVVKRAQRVVRLAEAMGAVQ